MKNKVVLVNITESSIFVYRKNGNVRTYKAQRGIISAKRVIDSLEMLSTNICKHVDPFTISFVHTFD